MTGVRGIVGYETVIKKWAPKPGDFFLTASRTGANQDIRASTNSRFGHAILFIGDMKPKALVTPETDIEGKPKTLTLPGKSDPLNCAELPLKIAPITEILRTDVCDVLMHVTKPNLSNADREKIVTLALTFIAQKYRGGIRDGYSDSMAYVYAPLEMLGAWIEDEAFIKKDNPFVTLSKFAAKLANGGVQSVVELYDEYPNLNCSSFIAWLYAEAGHRITTFSTTTTPRDLYEETLRSAHFTSHEMDFSAAVDLKVKPGDVPRAGAAVPLME